MKKYPILFLCWFSCSLGSFVTRGQFITNDPIHTGVTTLIKLVQDPSFKEIVQNIEKLKKVSSSVQQFERGRDIIVTINQCTQQLGSLSAAVAKDGHIYPAEYALLVADLSSLADAGSAIIRNMKAATTQSGGVLEMSDGERIRWINEVYKEVKAYEATINAYFAKIRTTSLRRSGNQRDLASTAKLYGAVYSPPAGFSGAGAAVSIDNRGYDPTYVDDGTSRLDSAYTSEAASKLRDLQEKCRVRIANYYDEKQLRESQMAGEALRQLLASGWSYQLKNPEFSLSSVLTTNIFSVVQDSEDTINNVKTLNNSTHGVTSEEITSTINNAVDGFINPDGKRVSNEEFQTILRITSRQLFLDLGINEQLMEKYQLAECGRMGY